MIVVKVGGSLFDMPELRTQLIAFIDSLHDPDCLLIPGGGAVADAVRELDRVHGLGEEASHWLALRACSLNAHFLLSLLPGSRLIAWPIPGRELCILDPLRFALADESRPGSLPHCWDATSDSLAARAAVAVGADLVLLKSITIPAEMTWQEVAAAGHVDRLLPGLIEKHGLRVRVVNLRERG